MACQSSKRCCCRKPNPVISILVPEPYRPLPMLAKPHRCPHQLRKIRSLLNRQFPRLLRPMRRALSHLKDSLAAILNQWRPQQFLFPLLHAEKKPLRHKIEAQQGRKMEHPVLRLLYQGQVEPNRMLQSPPMMGLRPHPRM